MMKRQCILFQFVLLVVLAAFVEGKNYRFDYTYNEEAGGWLKYHRVPDTFTSAFLRCHAEGAVLASPLNANLQKAMQMVLDADGSLFGIFTGINAIFSKQDYASVEGVPLARIPVKWAPHEPDNMNNREECTIMMQKGALADVPCNHSFPYMCFRKKTDDLNITPCGTVDKEYELDERTGSCYKFHRVGLSWRRAYMTCMAEGGHLAIINSDTEDQVIKDLFARNPDHTIAARLKNVASIGFYDISERTWFTIHGETLKEAGFSHFANGQPDNDKTHDNGSFCGAVFREGLLDDVWCRGTTIPFICEKKPDSLNAEEDR